jgi:hypothetical protein
VLTPLQTLAFVNTIYRLAPPNQYGDGCDVFITLALTQKTTGALGRFFS